MRRTPSRHEATVIAVSLLLARLLPLDFFTCSPLPLPGSYRLIGLRVFHVSVETANYVLVPGGKGRVLLVAYLR